jgi:predicted dehydrogenase
MQHKTTSRRRFVSAAAVSAARVLGANDRVRTGIIGIGNLGLRHIRERMLPLHERGVIEIVGASDIYEKAKERAIRLAALESKQVHHDYRDLLARRDVDAVLIVTPEHWHYRMAMDALRAGKDVYLEKPLSYTTEEASEIADSVKKTGRILQVGSQYVSDPRFRIAREVIERGDIGRVLWAQSTSGQNSLYGIWQYRIEPEATDRTIDWNAFLGSAPKRPFSAERYFRWRKYWDYSGGIAADLFYHSLSGLMMALGPRFPTSVSAHGGVYVWQDRETPDTFAMNVEYDNFYVSLSASAANSSCNRLHKTAIYGREATIEFANGAIEVTPEPLFRSRFKERTGSDKLRLEADPASADVFRMRHMENFFECVRSRKQPVFDAHFGLQVMAATDLAVRSYRQGGMFAWNPGIKRVVPATVKRAAFEGRGENYDEPLANPDGRVVP